MSRGAYQEQVPDFMHSEYYYNQLVNEIWAKYEIGQGESINMDQFQQMVDSMDLLFRMNVYF